MVNRVSSSFKKGDHSTTLTELKKRGTIRNKNKHMTKCH